MYALLTTLLIINVPLGLLLLYYFYHQSDGKKSKPDANAAAMKNVQTQLASVTELVERTSRRLNKYVGDSTLGNRRIIEFIDNFEQATGRLSSIDVSLGEAHSLVECLDELRGPLDAFDRGEPLPPEEGQGAESTGRERPGTAPAQETTSNANDLVEGPLTDDFRMSIDKLGKSDDWSSNRSSERRDVAFAVSAIPLDERHHPDGECIEGLARDLSTGGMSFCHTDPFDATLLAMELRCEESAPIYVLMEVRRTESFGPFLVSGGRFRSRLTSTRLIKMLKNGRVELELQPA